MSKKDSRLTKKMMGINMIRQELPQRKEKVNIIATFR